MAQGPARVASGSSAWVDITGKPSTFPPSAHTHPAPDVIEDTTHSFVTDAEKITWNAKVSFPGFGTTGTTAAVGNDARLSDARTPLAHNQAWSTITSTPTTLSGYGITDAFDGAYASLSGIPQDIATTATPKFERIGVGQAADGTRALSITGDTSTSGNLLAGTTTVGRRLTVSGNGIQVIGTTGTRGALVAEGTTVALQADSSVATRFLIDAGASNAAGYVAFNGGGTSGYIQFSTGGTERVRIATAGGVRFNAYGAGTLVTDSSGNITASSDRRLKNVSGKFTRGLDAIMEIQPKVFTWKPESGMNTEDVNVGFIAQDVQAAIPEAVGTVKTNDVEEDDKENPGQKRTRKERKAAEYLTLSDRPIIAALVNAVKELKDENDTLRARVSALENGKAAK